MGINLEIETKGIFPPNLDDEQPDMDLPHAAEQIDKGQSKTNYVSVTEQLDEARIELNRYKEKGYMVEVSEEEVKKCYKNGTISKLALIVKTKEDGTKKRRVIIDLKRSSGNLKARLPERLILPRPMDAVAMMRKMVLGSLERNDDKVPPKERWNRELVVIDISDAYMSLGVHPKEHEHCLAPGLDSDYVMFVAMLFGFKTAPLVWSRVAAWLSRLLQSITPVEFAQHQTYLDDQVWMLQGSLQQRNEVLGVVLCTMAALGFRINVSKGERGSTVVWIGVRLTLKGEILLLTLPQKFMAELANSLKEAKTRGMIGIHELRKLAGRVSWLAGVLPRARWTAAALYATMHAHLREVEQGEEARRREGRADPRNKDQLVPVKRFEGARKWLELYIEAALGQAVRKMHLRPNLKADVWILTDASPEGLGAILMVNNVVTKALASKVTEQDAEEFDFELGSSASQGLLEAMVLVVALKVWENAIPSGVAEVGFQSDSITALAWARKFSGPSKALNMLGAELSLQLEVMALEKVNTQHIAGVANVGPDWLSRPQKRKEEKLPESLKGITITEVTGRDSNSFRLPTVKLAPDMWGSAPVGSWAGPE